MNIIELGNKNSKIEMIYTNQQFQQIRNRLIELTKVCEPNNVSVNHSIFLKRGQDIFWIVKNIISNEIIGYIKTSDINMLDYTLNGNIPHKKGLYINGVCNGIPTKYKNVATPLLQTIEHYAIEKKYNYLLLYVDSDRFYLHENRVGKRPGLYIKNGYKKIKILKANDIGYLNDLIVMRKTIRK